MDESDALLAAPWEEGSSGRGRVIGNVSRNRGWNVEGVEVSASAKPIQDFKVYAQPFPDIPAGTNDLYLYLQFGRDSDPRGTGVSSLRIDQVRQRLETGTNSTEAVKLQLAQKSFLVGFSSFKVLELSPGRSQSSAGENLSSIRTYSTT